MIFLRQMFASVIFAGIAFAPLTNAATSQVALGSTSYSVNQSAGSVTVAIARTGTTAASVLVSTHAGTAAGGRDYTVTTTKLSWASGHSETKSVKIPINTESSFSGSRQLTVGLSSPSGTQISAPSSATVTITASNKSTGGGTTDGKPTSPVSVLSSEIWSAAYQSPANLNAAYAKSASIQAANGATYYARMNAWNTSSSGFRHQKTWANNEHDWGVIATNVNDGNVKSYSSVVRGWATGEGIQPMTKTIGLQISQLTKVHARWAFDAPSDYGGVGTNATNRVNVLWDTYFHSMPNPGGNDEPDVNLMINQYDVDGDGYFGGMAKGGQVVTLGGRQWRMAVMKGVAASGNTIQLFPGPFNDYMVMGTKDLTLDYLGVVKDLVSLGLIPANEYLTSIQVGYEMIGNGTLTTTAFWTAINNEADGNNSGSGTPLPTVTLKAASSSVSSGGSTTLSWSSTNATSCTASGAWAGNKAASGSQATGSLSSTSTYAIHCTGDGGQADASATVTVTGAAPVSPTVTLNANPASVTSGGKSTLSWSSTNATSCTASGAWSGTKATSGSETTAALTASGTFTLTCTGAGGNASASAGVTVTSSSPPPSNGNLPTLGGCTDAVVYEDSLVWPFDYSWGGPKIDYADTSGGPLTGTRDIKFQGLGGWQPAGPNWKADVSGCSFLTFALKPTIANASYHGQFLYVGDVATGIIVDYTGGKYGPANPPVGQWSIYKIPLTAFFPNGVVPATIYKFHIQTMQDSYGSDTFYIDHVGFTAN
jgi:Calx-beta domain